MRFARQQDGFGAGGQIGLALLGEQGHGEGVPAEGVGIPKNGRNGREAVMALRHPELWLLAFSNHPSRKLLVGYSLYFGLLGHLQGIVNVDART